MKKIALTIVISLSLSSMATAGSLIKWMDTYLKSVDSLSDYKLIRTGKTRMIGYVNDNQKSGIWLVLNDEGAITSLIDYSGDTSKRITPHDFYFENRFKYTRTLKNTDKNALDSIVFNEKQHAKARCDSLQLSRGYFKNCFGKNDCFTCDSLRHFFAPDFLPGLYCAADLRNNLFEAVFVSTDGKTFTFQFLKNDNEIFKIALIKAVDIKNSNYFQSIRFESPKVIWMLSGYNDPQHSNNLIGEGSVVYRNKSKYLSFERGGAIFLWKHSARKPAEKEENYAEKMQTVFFLQSDIGW